ncbi:MAG: protein BatD, partial [bacterium]|nr:protein BatD [bacterium]
MMDDLFDMMPFGQRAVYESFVVPSNSLALTVAEVPAAGRPDNFSGLVGNYRMAVQATPTEVNVGDPITLTLRISGPEYLDAIELPPLTNQTALARDFKIPPERAAGVVKGSAKSFTQTIRAKHSDVIEIPPIELAYFDADSGSYKVARTAAVPLTVQGTRIVTARDAEGFSDAGTVQSEI